MESTQSSDIDFKNGELKLYDEEDDQNFADMIAAEPDPQVKFNVEGGQMCRPATVEGLRKHYEVCGDGLIEEKALTNKMYELYGHSRPMTYVKFFYVLPQYRSYGIGKRVLEEIFKMSKEKGIDLVVLYVVPENDKGLKFY